MLENIDSNPSSDDFCIVDYTSSDRFTEVFASETDLSKFEGDECEHLKEAIFEKRLTNSVQQRDNLYIELFVSATSFHASLLSDN